MSSPCLPDFIQSPHNMIANSICLTVVNSSQSKGILSQDHPRDILLHHQASLVVPEGLWSRQYQPARHTMILGDDLWHLHSTVPFHPQTKMSVMTGWTPNLQPFRACFPPLCIGTERIREEHHQTHDRESRHRQLGMWDDTAEHLHEISHLQMNDRTLTKIRGQ